MFLSRKKKRAEAQFFEISVYIVKISAVHPPNINNPKKPNINNVMTIPLNTFIILPPFIPIRGNE